MSSLEEQCHIDKGTYTDGPVLTKDIRNLFDRIAELEAEVARLTELLEPEECDGGCPERTCLRCCSDRLAKLEAENTGLKKDRERLEWLAANGAEIFDDWGDDLTTELPLAKRWRVSWVQKTMGRWPVKEVWACDWRPAIDEAMSVEAGDD